MAGLTEEGFLAETFQSLEEQIFARLRNVFSAGLPLDDSTIEGQSWKILIEALTKLWELGELIYAAMDPDKATGAALDALCVLTGTIRDPPSFGVGKLILWGDDATSVPSGTEVRIGADGATATSVEDATLAIVDAYVALATNEVGELVSNAGNIYVAVVGGVNGGITPAFSVRPIDISDPAIITTDGGLTTTDTTDGAVIWVWLGTAAAAVSDVAAVATEFGPVNYPAFAIDTVSTPVVGLEGSTNLLDFDIGADVQTDESLRIAREANLSAPGTGTRDAIRAALLALNGVISVTIFVNSTNVVDAGLPPKSIEALVRGGEDQDIFDCLLANVAAGIETYGSGAGLTTGTAADSEGTSHAVTFTRPTEVDIYVAMTLTKDVLTYPDDGDDAVKQKVVDFGDLQKTGKDAVAQSIGAQANKVDGVQEVTEVLISTAPGPTLSTTIPITLRQLAVFDTSRVTVASSDVTP